MSLNLSAATNAYLADLDKSPATIRARRWALTDLATFAAAHTGDINPPAATALADDVLAAWIAQPGIPVATQRSKAAAARALTQYLRDRGDLTTSAEPAPALRMQAPPRASVDTAGARYLLHATGGDIPYPIPAAIWSRFVAHVHVLAATGATESQLAGARLEDISANHELITLKSEPYPLTDPARHALAAWLEMRRSVTLNLQGADPSALWIRIHPGRNHRTKTIAPAGLKITERGLRHSFTVVRDTLAATDPRLADVTVRDVRALGRDEWTPTRPNPLDPPWDPPRLPPELR